MLEIKNISVRFSAGSDVQAVQDVSFTLHDHEKIALVGETGSGKSVLLLAILNLLPKYAIVEGQALLNGQDLMKMTRKELNKVRGKDISYIPQGGGGSLNPLMKVGFQVGEPLMEHYGMSKKQATEQAIFFMKKMNLGDEEQLANSYPHTFSGGMRQRAMIAMGISAGSQVLLADEPSKGLDEDRVGLVVNTFNSLKNESLICVTHDLSFASKISQKICVMYSAMQVEFASTEMIFSDPLHPYTKALVRAIPENGMHIDSSGFAISHYDYGDSGCRYSKRCPHCSEKCAKLPPLFSVGDRKVRCWLYETEN